MATEPATGSHPTCRHNRYNAVILNENVSLAIVFADVSDNLRHYETLDDKVVLERIESCRSILATLSRKHNGKIVKAIGHELMYTFPDAAHQQETATAHPYWHALRSRQSAMGATFSPM